jgi:hypothetical protein
MARGVSSTALHVSGREVADSRTKFVALARQEKRGLH